MPSAKPKTRAGRPLKPLITREAAVAAALEAIDSDGLEALSVQAVARRMNVAAPSLYYHFKDKDELLQLVAFELLRQIGETGQTDGGWRERVVALSLATRRTALRHANAAPLMLRFFPRRLLLGAYERSLVDCPYPVQHHMVVLEAVEKLTYGDALFAAAAESYHTPAMPAFDAPRFPLLAQAIKAGKQDEEQLFLEALAALFAGFDARFDRTAAG